MNTQIKVLRYLFFFTYISRANKLNSYAGLRVIQTKNLAVEKAVVYEQN